MAKEVPPFSWGPSEKEVHEFDKFIETAQKVLNRREKKLNKADIELLKFLHEEYSK